jgi:hypothetical protein
LWISKDIYVYLWIYRDEIGYEKINCRISLWINAGYLWICNEYPYISKKDIHSYPKWYPLISFQDILEISDSVDISGYLRISQDIPGYLFGANSQMRSSARSESAGADCCMVRRRKPSSPGTTEARRSLLQYANGTFEAAGAHGTLLQEGGRKAALP